MNTGQRIKVCVWVWGCEGVCQGVCEGVCEREAMSVCDVCEAVCVRVCVYE